MEATTAVDMTPRTPRLAPPSPRRRWGRLLAPLAGLGMALTVLAPMAPSRADTAQAFCVLSWAKGSQPLEKGPCVWSQRQGNANILFKKQRFDFPAAEEGKTYTRDNREGDEAGPFFTRPGKYTLSVYWKQPAKDKAGW